MKKLLKESQLHNYQRRAVDHIMGRESAGLFLEMGLGKTVSTLTAINKLMFEDLEVMNCLVIAPKRVAESVWHREIAKWEHLKHLTYSRIIGTEKQRLAALKDKVDIHLIGRDNIVWLVDQFGGGMLPWDMIVIDESSSFKNHKSQRFKALRGVIPSIARVVILTGTPAPNSLVDIWAQIFLLDNGERLGRFITKFKKEYFNNISRSNQYEKLEIRSTSVDLIYEKIGDICISMKAKDYLELPGRINNYIDISLPDKIQRQYDNFKEQQILEMYERIDGEITAANVAALMNKLLQFANGAVYEDTIYDIDEEGNLKAEPRVWHEVHKEKIKALEEVLESAAGNPVLVAWTYRHDLYRIEKHLAKYNPRRLKTDQDIDDWNAGKIPLMLMHPASSGHGLNLQEGGHIIVWFGQTWSLELYQQFNARLDRQGQEDKVVIHHLVAHNTMDKNVINRLADKTITQDALFDAVKADIENYLK